MGGYGCGGQNQTHGCTASCKRLDSFFFGKCIQQAKVGFWRSMSWTDGSSVAACLYNNRVYVRYTVTRGGAREDVREAIYFDTVPNNYGGPQRVYFTCPRCGRRCRLLYMAQQHFRCRTCAGVNYPSQQTTRGADAAAHRMDRFLREKFGVEERLAPVEAAYYIPGRPKGMHQATYERLREELEQLQDQYERAWIAGCSRLVGLKL